MFTDLFYPKVYPRSSTNILGIIFIPLDFDKRGRVKKKALCKHWHRSTHNRFEINHRIAARRPVNSPVPKIATVRVIKYELMSIKGTLGKSICMFSVAVALIQGRNIDIFIRAVHLPHTVQITIGFL